MTTRARKSSPQEDSILSQVVPIDAVLILNAYWEPLDFELPKLGDKGPWRRWIDTALDSPTDIVPWQEATGVQAESYRAQARSVAMLFGGRSSA